MIDHGAMVESVESVELVESVNQTTIASVHIILIFQTHIILISYSSSNLSLPQSFLSSSLQLKAKAE
jgi:hypothetical protein